MNNIKYIILKTNYYEHCIVSSLNNSTYKFAFHNVGENSRLLKTALFHAPLLNIKHFYKLCL